MNKILRDENYILNTNKLSLTIKGESELFITNDIKDIELEINLVDRSVLKIFDYNSQNKKTTIIVNQSNDSKFYYYHGFDIALDYSLNYRAYINGNNNLNYIKVQGITSGNVCIDADEIVKESTNNNEVIEDIKILNNEGKATILPKLSVKTLNVNATHKNTISNIRKDYLFYLETKGIDKNKAIELIKDGYRYGSFMDNKKFMNLIK